MAARVTLLFAVVAASIGAVFSQMSACSDVNIRTCGQCISQAGCAWCYQRDFMLNRCQPVSNLTTSCMTDFIANPMSETVPLEARSGPVSIETANLRLRVGDPETFMVSVTPQRNLPLDLYILMDLSSSMDTELATIKRVSSSIIQSISNITDNVQLGLGAFNEKLVQPFFVQPLGDVCTQGACSPNSFAVRHIINLTNDSVAFNETVQSLVLTSNVDPPENGLEGLAQVIVCEDIVGWRGRENTRGSRVILFMTDNDFHYAGEGRLAGILRPYNGECLMSRAPGSDFAEFTEYAEYDYPSVGQILELMTDNDVATIFAVSTAQNGTYQNLVSLLNTNALRAAVDTFDPDGADTAANEETIINLIRNQYTRLLQDVTLAVQGSDDDLEVQFVAQCPDGSTGSGCTNVPFDTPVPFTVTATLRSCQPEQNGTVKTVRVESRFGSFDIRYTIICNCDCANEEMMILDLNQCSGTGMMRCGVCECFNNTCGADCNITLEGRSLDCPVGGNQLTCSGPDNGVCDCGCVCNSGGGREISGPACECNNFGCLESHVNGVACSGNGLCCNGQCMCFSNVNNTVIMDINGREPDVYRPRRGINYCQCPPARIACFDGPSAQEPCNGVQGSSCDCEFCTCPPSRQGRYCELERDDSCGNSKDSNAILMLRNRFSMESDLPDVCDCTTNTFCDCSRPVLFLSSADIVRGVQEEIGRGTAAAAAERSYYTRIANERLGASASNSDSQFQFLRDNCVATDDERCTIDYVVVGNATHSAIIVTRERVCPEPTSSLPFPVWVLPIIIFGVLLFLGALAIILIKIIIRILDYIEVKRWQNEAKDADFSKNQNPLYQSPEMKYENVAYGRE